MKNVSQGTVLFWCLTEVSCKVGFAGNYARIDAQRTALKDSPQKGQAYWSTLNSSKQLID